MMTVATMLTVMLIGTARAHCVKALAGSMSAITLHAGFDGS